MGYESTDDAGDVPRCESDTELSWLAVGLLWSGEDMRVEQLGDLLEETAGVKSAWQDA